MKRPPPLSLAAAVAVLAFPVRAQQPSFRATTELIVVDVSVVSGDGTPVRGLQASNFKVRIDGQPRQVRSLQFIGQSGAAAPGGAPLRPQALRVSSNASDGIGRLALILVDEGSIAFGGLQTAARSVDRLLAGFGPADKVGLAALPGPRTLVDYTENRAAIAAALKRITGGASALAGGGIVRVAPSEAFAIQRGDPAMFRQVVARECPPDDPGVMRACERSVEMEANRVVMEERSRTAQFVSGLRVLLRQMTAVDAPKLLIVMSEGFTDPEAINEMIACGDLATAARTTIFALRLDRAMFDLSTRRAAAAFVSREERSWAKDSLDTLAGAARGTAFEILGSGDQPFSRLARELSGYYLLGVEADPRDRDGKAHQIKVEVDRAGVSVRARRQVIAPRPAKDEKRLLAQVLGSPLPVADIPLRVGTFNMPDEDPGKVRVLVVAEVDVEQAADTMAQVAVVFRDRTGRTTGNAGQRVALTRLDSGSLSLVLTTQVAPGPFAMKLAVARGGRAGSVEHRGMAVLNETAPGGNGGAAAPLQLGELLVTSPAGERALPSLDGRVVGDRVLSFVQVGRGLERRPGTDFIFDIVKDEAGAALLSAPGTVGRGENTPGPVAEAAIDARLLPPGDYGIRVNVLDGGTKIAHLFTPFHLDRPRRSRADGWASPVGTSGRPRAARPADKLPFARRDALEGTVLSPFLEEVARLSPSSSRPALELARAGRLDEAVRSLEPGQPGDPALPFLRGLALFDKGDLQRASDQFRAAILEAPELLVGAFYLGACYAAGGRDAQAIGAWQTSLAGLDRYPAVYRFLGDALLRTGQADRAQQLLGSAAARWPDEEAFRARVVRATVEAGRYEQALEYADRLIAAQPRDSSVLFLAMRSAFHALLEDAGVEPRALLERLQRYRSLYQAADGLQQPLVDEWVRFAEARTKSRE